MHHIKISIDICAEGLRTEKSIKQALEIIFNLFKNDYSPDDLKINYSNKSNETSTPDDKYIIGNIYELENGLYGLLLNTFDNGDGSYHLQFMLTEKNNLNDIEKALGFNRGYDIIKIGDLYLNRFNYVGYMWKDGYVYNYIHDKTPINCKYITTVEDAQFTKIYKDYIKEN